MSKQVWFALAEESSSGHHSAEGNHVCGVDEPSQSFHHLEELSTFSDLSQYSLENLLRVNRYRSLDRDLSQYSLDMDSKPNETYSTNDSQDVSSSAQETTGTSEGTGNSISMLGLEEGSASSSVQDSIHDEVVNSAIMEVSGELMLGKFSPQKCPSGGSESSDISDDDRNGHPRSIGGSIAKYPESSTGLSDNDWNPYATESDTNHTPRSVDGEERKLPNFFKAPVPKMFRDSDDSFGDGDGASPRNERQVVYRSEFMMGQPLKKMEVNTSDGDSQSRLDRLRYEVEMENRPECEGDRKQARDKYRQSDLHMDLRPEQEKEKSDRNDGDAEPIRVSTESGFSSKSSQSRNSDTLKFESTESLHSSRSGQSQASYRENDQLRTSAESAHSQRSSQYDVDENRRISGESTQSRRSYQSSSPEEADFRRISAESAGSLRTEGSGRQSTESGKLSTEGDSRRESAESGHSSRSTLSRGSGNTEETRRTSAESGRSFRSDQSRGTENSGEHRRESAESTSSVQSARSDILDRSNETGNGTAPELFRSEASQRKEFESEPPCNDREQTQQGKTSITSGRYATSYIPEKSALRVDNGDYVPVSQRERLMNESPNTILADKGKAPELSRDYGLPHKPEVVFDRSRFGENGGDKGRSSDRNGARSPSDISMKRVAHIFEETKKQVREAVSLPRPDPSGSEERFPLHERLSWSQHADDSFLSKSKLGETSAVSDRSNSRLDKSRESETRSITSEEVARVLGKNEPEPERRQHTEPVDSYNQQESPVRVSAFDRVEPHKLQTTHEQPQPRGESTEPEVTPPVAEMSDDEIARRVRAILTDTSYLSNGRSSTQSNVDLMKGNVTNGFVPHSMDYKSLEQDLQEIQDSLHGPEVPAPKANDSLHFRMKASRNAGQEGLSVSDQDTYKSTETVSGESSKSRRFLWDHAADLGYNDDYSGEFFGTMTETDTETLSRKTKTPNGRDSEGLVVRPDSTTTNETDNDVADIEPVTLTSSGSENLLNQILNRQAEGNLTENVEDIIMKYRNQRQDLFERFQPENDGQPNKVVKIPENIEAQNSTESESDAEPKSAIQPPPQSASDTSLAKRIYTILSADDKYKQPPPDVKTSMAKEVFNILSQERPDRQVNGILTDTLEQERNLLNRLADQPATRHSLDTSADDFSLDSTTNTFGIQEDDIRRQLEWSEICSPAKDYTGLTPGNNKSNMSDFDAIQKMTSAPYSAFNNAKTFLSSQLKKMSERNFDKSVELRTPCRQVIDCYPVYGVDKEPKEKQSTNPKPDEKRSEDKTRRTDNLASERFFLTSRDVTPPRTKFYAPPDELPRQRTYSDPFEVSPTRRVVENNWTSPSHARSKSEEGAMVSDLSMYSMTADSSESATDNRAASSPFKMRRLEGDTVDAADRQRMLGATQTPVKSHHQFDRGQVRESSTSPTESDTSGSKATLSKLRPYRPAGSRDVYYTESGDDTNDSGTTVESTHPGSDDAVPPYIPSQFLGSRKEEPQRHATGIYGKPDSLSTIDERSNVDDKEKALSEGSRGSDPLKLSANATKEADLARQIRDNEYSSRRADIASKPRDTASQPILPRSEPVPRSSEPDRPSSKSPYAGQHREEIFRKPERPRSKSPRTDAYSMEKGTERRSPVQRDSYLTLTERERRLRQELDGRQQQQQQQQTNLTRDGRRSAEADDLQRSRGQGYDRQRGLEDRRSDGLGTSVRSDPGGQIEIDQGLRRADMLDQQDLSGFRPLQAEPLYPRERLRCSRSKSETNLMSPLDSQKYSSPVVPGTGFLELSDQPSPIYHQDSLTIGRDKHADLGHPPVTSVGPTIERSVREMMMENRYPRSGVRDRDAGQTDQGMPMELPRVLDRDQSSKGGTKRSPLDRPREDRQMDSGADPASIRSHSDGQLAKRTTEERRRSDRTDRAKSPLHVREKELQRGLEELKQELDNQIGQTTERKPDSEGEFEDRFPPSKKAQALRQVLEQEYIESIPPNINDMWTRFQETKANHSQTESSINSTRMDALEDLLKNPTQHTVTSFLKEKQTDRNRQKVEDQERQLLLKERQQREIEQEKREILKTKAAMERALKERNLRRQELQQRSGLSEEESNGSYSEFVVASKENTKREKVRKVAPRKKDTSPEVRRKTSPEKSSKDKRSSSESKSRRKEDKIMQNSHDDQSRHSDTIDTLFSIPEDASFETSPGKSPSAMKAKQRRHRHVIDPLMNKLHDKIKMQRDKIDKERRKELMRVQKLKKLEMLLNAKRKGKLSDRAIDVELNNFSTTSVSHSESSSLQLTDSTLVSSGMSAETTASSVGNYTVSDSSMEAPKLQVKRYIDMPVDTSTNTESSDFNNIIVERLPSKSKSDRNRSEKRSSSKGRNSKVVVDEFGNQIKRDKKEKKKKNKKDLFVEQTFEDSTDEALARQLRKYMQMKTPDRKDVATMYPSPIVVSPPRRQRTREVVMKSAAIQTTPGRISYDEVPCAPVPLMSAETRKSSRSPRRTSPSSRQSSPSYSRRKSPSPAPAPADKRKVVEKKKPSLRVREPEISKPPPKSSMFTPEEADENCSPVERVIHETGTAWFVPLKPSRPWRKPLKERQAFAIQQEPWKPTSVTEAKWRNIVNNHANTDQADLNDTSRDTKFDLDPEGHLIKDGDTDSDSDESDLDLSKSRPLSKMTLQEAFLLKRQDAISHCRERQKRLCLAAEERRMQAYLQTERDQLFHEQRKKESNPGAHPYSDNLFKPVRRTISKEEMKESTEKKYKKLPEVLEKQKLKKRKDEYTLNRLNARLFNRKVQKKVLVKADIWGK